MCKRDGYRVRGGRCPFERGAPAGAWAPFNKGTSARVTLIRFHVIPDSKLKPATTAVMEDFRDRLNSHGITATIRASRGEDIMAACGMLAGKKKDEQNKK